MNHLGLFAKYWEPGKVKTRLAATIGPDAACRVYRCFLSHLGSALADVADVRTVGFSPADKQVEFEALMGEAWNLVPQSPGDLGVRMRHFFDSAHQANALLRSQLEPASPRSKVILIGSDTPNLSSDRIQNAFELLGEQQVVLGPCSDGGYYLIGMAEQTFELFENVDWSTERVLEQTMNKLAEQGIEFSLLPQMTDVDQESDLVELICQLRDGQSRLSQNDVSLLAAIDDLNLERISQ